MSGCGDDSGDARYDVSGSDDPGSVMVKKLLTPPIGLMLERDASKECHAADEE